MKRSVLKGFARQGVFLAVLLVLWLCVAGLALGQAAGAASQPAAKAAMRASPAQMATSAAPDRAQAEGTVAKHGGGGMHEGIKVHGHWKIDVSNPDGKLVSHTEFENSLYTGNGFTNPSAYFSRTLTLGEWGITLSGSPAPCPATIPFTFATHYAYLRTSFEFGGPFCVLSDNPPTAAIEPQNCAAVPNTGCSQNLKVSTDSSGNLNLTGNVVVANSGTISQVQTILSTCAPTVSPSACASETNPDNVNDDFLNAFTAASLPQGPPPGSASSPCGGTGQISCAVPVTAGQTVNVSVTISFQ